MLKLCSRFGRLAEITKPAKTLNCYASTSKPKEDSLPVGYRKTPPFGIYLKEQYVKKEGVSVTEQMSKLKNRWNSMTPVEKQVYFDESEAELKQKRAKFDALSEEEKHKLLEENVKQREDRKKRKVRAEKAAKRETTHRPSRPPSAYNLYVKANMALKERGQQQVRQRFKELAANWKLLPDNDRKKYSDEAAVLMKKFEEDMRIWKEKTEREAMVKKAKPSTASAM